MRYLATVGLGITFGLQVNNSGLRFVAGYAMNLLSKSTLVAGCILFASTLQAQVVTLTPNPAALDDSLDIIFDANLGNAGLASFAGTVYAHCGLITPASTSPTDWKYIVGNWGTADARTRMTPLGGGRHRLRIKPRAFYGLPASPVVINQYAFVFRNQQGNITGRASNGADIYVSLPPSTPARSIQSYQLVNGRLKIVTESELFVLQAYGDSSLRVSYHPDQIEAYDSNYVVVQAALTSATVVETDTSVEYITPSLRAVATKSPYALSVYLGGRLLTHEDVGFFKRGASEVGVAMSLRTGEVLQGGGSRTLPINRRGQVLSMYNTAIYGYQQGNTLNLCIPFFASSRGYGLLFDHVQPAQADLGSSSPSALTYTAEGGRFGYYVMAGSGYAGVLRNYTALTGRQTLPPRWALGYLQSRYGYENEAQTRQIATDLRTAGYPLDGLFLDLYWFGSPSTMGNLNWDLTRFPQPTTLMSELRAKGIHTLLITEPYFTLSSSTYSTLNGLGLLARSSGTQPYVINGFWAGPASLIDVTRIGTDAWWWPSYRNRVNEGVDAWWSDLGEPEDHPNGMAHATGPARAIHNIYSLLWARILWNGYRAEFPTRRLFNVIRSGWAGMQRYGTFPWSGDVDRSFAALRLQVPLMIGGGMSGTAYLHTNVGGFAGGSQNAELYTRWHQLGVFSPIDWCHSNVSVLPEPIYWDAATQGRVRSLLQLRTRLHPALYSLAYENALTGAPILRPMDYYAPGDATLAAANEQFYFGRDLIVAPVVQAGQTQRSVALPAGAWRDFFTGTAYVGGSTVTVPASVDVVPVLARLGSVTALAPYRPALVQLAMDSLTLRWFADATAPSLVSYLYQDDGTSFNSIAAGQYERIELRTQHSASEYRLELTQNGGFTGAPNNRKMEIEVPKMTTAPLSVSFGGATLPVHAIASAYRTTSSGTYFDAAAQRLYAKATWAHQPAAFVISLGGTTSVDSDASATASSVTISPNPATLRATLRSSKLSVGQYHVELVQTSGVVVRTVAWAITDPSSAQLELDLTGLSAGIYLVRVSTREGKLVEQRRLVVGSR